MPPGRGPRDKDGQAMLQMAPILKGGAADHDKHIHGQNTLCTPPLLDDDIAGLDRFDESDLSESVQKVLACRAKHGKKHPIPAPCEFQQPSSQLQALRDDKVWSKGGDRDAQAQQMQLWFPDLDRPAASSLSRFDFAELKRGVTTSKHDHGKRKKPKKPGQPTCCDSSDDQQSQYPQSTMGLFSELPGELRNRIYRFAVVSDQPIQVKMEAMTCSVGECRHKRVEYNVPGIAQTCRQMRWEVMPIWCGENQQFIFDAAVVRNACVHHFLRSLGHFADFIHEVTLELLRPICTRYTHIGDTSYFFTIRAPGGPGEEGFMLSYKEEYTRKICCCPLVPLIENMSVDNTTPPGLLLEGFLTDEDFEDFVWRLHKNKVPLQLSPRCQKCGEEVLNS